ncbi:hypothetical protein M5689_007165 [Euphorbia peplus]|nr:hypothetical protein M5689_007165 [Euphorbia peplus]
MAGFVVRDCMGSVVLCGAKCWSAEHAEILAILNGINFAKQCGASKIIVASDCLKAIKAICTNEDSTHMDTMGKAIRMHASFFSDFLFRS